MPDHWIEVDIDALVHNYRQVLTKLSPGSSLMAVVKADAYGLGAVACAKALELEGCKAFAVTSVEEGLLLRNEGITGSILVLGPSSPESWPQAIQQGLELTLSGLRWIPLLAETAHWVGVQAVVHVKLETGMGRTGFLEEQLPALAEALQASPGIRVAGAYSHLARGPERDHAYSHEQNRRLIRSIQLLEEQGLPIPCKHLCNSAGFLDFPEYHYDYVRIGTLLGGHCPSPVFAGSLQLQDPWQAKAKILHVQRVPAGTYVGYQSLYKTKKETTLAVLPLGYADGFGLEPRPTPQGLVDLAKVLLKNILAYFGIQVGREKIRYKGQTVRIAGKIGMQLTTLDLGDHPCQAGEEILIPLRRTSASARIPRLYKKEGKLFRKRTVLEGFHSIHEEDIPEHIIGSATEQA